MTPKYILIIINCLTRLLQQLFSVLVRYMLHTCVLQWLQSTKILHQHTRTQHNVIPPLRQLIIITWQKGRVCHHLKIFQENPWKPVKNGDGNAPTSPRFKKRFEHFGKYEKCRGQPKRKDAKLKISWRTGSKIPGEGKELSMRGKNLDVMVTRLKIKLE